MAGTLGTALSVAAIAASAAGVGTSIYEGQANRSSTADNAKKSAQSTAAQANLTKREAVLGQQGQAQQQTGGSLTDSGTAALTDLLAGYPGYSTTSGTGSNSGTGSSANAGTTSTAIADTANATGGGMASGVGANSAIAPTTLSSGGSTGGGSDSSSAVASILAALRGGGGSGGGGSTSSISGGNWQSQTAQPQPYHELANPLV